VDNPLYHVLLGEDRRLGPYDRRTIVGMRVRKTLANDNVLLGPDGTQLTVEELVYQGLPTAVDVPVDLPVSIPGGEGSDAGRPGSSYSVVQGIHAAQLLEVQGTGYEVPPFKGQVEVRVQTRALRISGRFREGLAWKEDRVKIPLQEIPHARLRGTIVDLWVRAAGQPEAQRVSLDLLTREAAGELAEALPLNSPYPGSEPLAARTTAAGPHPLLWAAVVGTAIVVVGILLWVLMRGR
jgi:hypothetical protein